MLPDARVITITGLLARASDQAGPVQAELVQPKKQQIVEVGLGLGLRPMQLNLYWVKGLFGKKNLYALPFLFHSFLFWYLAK